MALAAHRGRARLRRPPSHTAGPRAQRTRRRSGHSNSHTTAAAWHRHTSVTRAPAQCKAGQWQPWDTRCTVQVVGCMHACMHAVKRRLFSRATASSGREGRGAYIGDGRQGQARAVIPDDACDSDIVELDSYQIAERCPPLETSRGRPKPPESAARSRLSSSSAQDHGRDPMPHLSAQIH